MKYLVVQREPLVIFDELSIPLPLSHRMEEMEAKRFLNARRFLDPVWRTAKVMPESHFVALGGK